MWRIPFQALVKSLVSDPGRVTVPRVITDPAAGPRRRGDRRAGWPAPGLPGLRLIPGISGESHRFVPGLSRYWHDGPFGCKDYS